MVRNPKSYTKRPAEAKKDNILTNKTLNGPMFIDTLVVTPVLWPLNKLCSIQVFAISMMTSTFPVDTLHQSNRYLFASEPESWPRWKGHSFLQPGVFY